jgi:hypothetical protein
MNLIVLKTPDTKSCTTPLKAKENIIATQIMSCIEAFSVRQAR